MIIFLIGGSGQEVENWMISTSSARSQHFDANRDCDD